MSKKSNYNSSLKLISYLVMVEIPICVNVIMKYICIEKKYRDINTNYMNL